MVFEPTARRTVFSNPARTLGNRALRAIAMLLILINILYLSIFATFPFGIFLNMIALGASTYYLLTSVSLTRKPEGTPASLTIPAKVVHTYVGSNLFDDLPVPMIDVATDGKIVRANLAAARLMGHTDLSGKNLAEVMEGLGRSINDRMSDTVKGLNPGRPEMARCYREGQEVFVQLTMSRMKRGDATSVLAVLSDATELKTLEAQFVQSQKMQAVGQLAGGVAHDFNNILTAITGHADLLLHRADPRDPNFDDLMQIKQNANRAAALIRQLLAFSRKQTLQPKSLHLDDTLSELSHLLNRLLGEKVDLQTEHGANLFCIRADERQLEQVIVNLVVNARDSMPNGGTVSIKTRNLTLNKELHRDQAIVQPGDYVVVEVRDTGVGIAKDKVSKIFEPFFTTKKVGEGTGLGLSTVYGIVKQSGGFIFVDSEVGVGSNFLIYLPANDEVIDAVEEPPRPAPNPIDHTGRGRILLVEDEAPVRAFAARALTLRGYSVTEAASGEEALEVLASTSTRFDVFVSDVVMPGMDGPSWVREAMKSVPDVKVIFVSGYAEDSFKDGKIEIPNASFLAKPFSLVELTQKVKDQIET